MTKPNLDNIQLHAIIEITWDDAWYVDQWESSTDYETDIESITSIGYYLETTDRYLIIAQSFQPDQVGQVFRIPRLTIQTIRRL